MGNHAEQGFRQPAVEKRSERRSSKNNIFLAGLVAAAQACGVQLQVSEYGVEAVRTEAAAAHSTELPTATLQEVRGTFRHLENRVHASLQEGADHTQLPHIMGTSVYHTEYDHTQELQLNGLPQREFDQRVTQFNDAVRRVQVETADGHSQQALSVSYRMATAHIEGGSFTPRTTAGTRIDIQAVSRESTLHTNPAEAGTQEVSTNIPEEDPDTDAQEGCHAIGHNEQEATALAFVQLINNIPKLATTHSEQGTFGVGNGATGPTPIHLSFANREAGFYLSDMRVSFVTKGPGMVEATLHGHFRIYVPTSHTTDNTPPVPAPRILTLTATNE